MKVVLTGSNGFIGSNLVAKMVDRNIEVVAVDKNDADEILTRNVKYLKLNLALDDLNLKEFDDTDAVIHLSAMSNLFECNAFPIKCVQDNVISTLRILDLLKSKNIKKFIFASSLYAISNRGSVYSITKKACEDLIIDFCERNLITWNILRYGSIYGYKKGKKDGLSKLIYDILFSEEVRYSGSKNSIRKYIHINDAVNSTIDIINQNIINKFIHINGKDYIKVLDVINLIQDIAGVNKPIIFEGNKDLIQYEQTPYSLKLENIEFVSNNNFIELDFGLLSVINQMTKKDKDE